MRTVDRSDCIIRLVLPNDLMVFALCHTENAEYFIANPDKLLALLRAASNEAHDNNDSRAEHICDLWIDEELKFHNMCDHSASLDWQSSKMGSDSD